MEVSLREQNIQRRRSSARAAALPRISLGERLKSLSQRLHLLKIRRKAKGAYNEVRFSSGGSRFVQTPWGAPTAGGEVWYSGGAAAGLKGVSAMVNAAERRVISPLYGPVYLAVFLFFLIMALGYPFGFLPAQPMNEGFPAVLTLPAESHFETLMSAQGAGDTTGSADVNDRAAVEGSPVAGEPLEGLALASLKESSYTVQAGDAISQIANRFDLTVGTLISYNGISDVRRIREGMELKIPNMDGVLYKVNRGDNLSVITHRYGISLNDVLDVNNLETETIFPGTTLFLPAAAMDSFRLKKALGELFIYPTRGRLTSYYGMRADPFTGIRQFHNGIDLANKAGTGVKAAMDGRVRETGVHSVYGNYVIISHAGQYQTLYAHLSRVRISRGQRVNQGQLIGSMGNTGYSTGNHLHFSIFRRGKHVNPLEYLH